MDRGPWQLFYGAPPERKLKGVISDDFEHDVHLEVKGDFTDDAEKLAYCQSLLIVLNRK